ncbi:hypothetical protein VNTUMSATTG_59990 (plasmid) [Vibrio nigripulchritudo]|nr:hypothetical protein VNTUMSATTG_59990 [Vibrio nigripulchritudo]
MVRLYAVNGKGYKRLALSIVCFLLTYNSEVVSNLLNIDQSMLMEPSLMVCAVSVLSMGIQRHSRRLK